MRHLFPLGKSSDIIPPTTTNFENEKLTLEFPLNLRIQLIEEDDNERLVTIISKKENGIEYDPVHELQTSQIRRLSEYL